MPEDVAALDEDDFDFLLACEQARQGRIDAPGARLRGSQLTGLARLLPADPEGRGRRRAEHVDLSRATIDGPCSLEHVTFAGPALFASTDFRGDAQFVNPRFEGRTAFAGARFCGFAAFARARFEEREDHGLPRAEVSFWGTRFEGDALFPFSRFRPDARFSRATFASIADFSHSHFEREALFDGASFDDDLDLVRAEVDGSARFEGARFRAARTLGPVRVVVCLSFDNATFETPVRVEASTSLVSCQSTAFRSGADLMLRWAMVHADGADFADRSIVAGHVSSTHPDFFGMERPDPYGTWTEGRHSRADEYAPRLMSLRGAKVAQLTLAGVDLTRCHFATAHGLDQIRLEQVLLRQPPLLRRLHPQEQERMPIVHRRMWTRRQTIAEEHDWRVRRGDRAWGDDMHLGHALLAPRPDAGQIAGIYRALRKSREDSKDQAGAGDFYYGEMEMRRQREHSAKHTSVVRPGARVERLLIWVYWLVSGYGLRASRAFAALAISLGLLAIPLDAWCFHPDRTYGRSLLFAVESSISPFRAPAAGLTTGGQVVQIALRLAGPLFFGLAALALRNRVKR